MAGLAVTGDLTFDVMSLGVVAVDDLLYVETYPPPDRKIPVVRRERHLGGLAATSLVAAARLGCKCTYTGMLGDDELSRIVIEGLRRENIDVSHLSRHPDARPVHSTIIIGDTAQTRNIFYSVPEVRGTHPELPEASLIRQTGVLLIDDFSAEQTLRVASIAHEAHVPLVADFEAGNSPRLQDLLGLVDHLILSYDFASRITGETQPAVIAESLWTEVRQVVVITCGIDGAWYLTGPHRDFADHQPAFAVNTVDTTGCGDVFHGAYAAGLVYGLDVAERIRFAAATAALKTTKSGGQAGIPTLSVVKSFLEERAQ
jgi:sulfofructose kinase